MALPVALYIPNLLGYARIILAFAGLHLSQTRPDAAFFVWILSAFLDLFDGLLARALDQCSSLGVLLDIAADNILRTIVWIGVLADDPSYRFIAGIFICLEWVTMICTQLHATQSGGHWKEQRENDPWLLRTVFQNNFRNPLGTLVIYGLFAANLCVYGSQHAIIYQNFPFFVYFKYAAFLGRGISGFVELYMCKGYISMIIERDIKEKEENSNGQGHSKKES
jgi:CDP-diacylglycerol--inositol 3-phosphatidyltransferase